MCPAEGPLVERRGGSGEPPRARPLTGDSIVVAEAAAAAVRGGSGARRQRQRQQQTRDARRRGCATKVRRDPSAGEKPHLLAETTQVRKTYYCAKPSLL